MVGAKASTNTMPATRSACCCVYRRTIMPPYECATSRYGPGTLPRARTAARSAACASRVRGLSIGVLRVVMCGAGWSYRIVPGRS